MYSINVFAIVLYCIVTINFGGIWAGNNCAYDLQNEIVRCANVSEMREIAIYMQPTWERLIIANQLGSVFSVAGRHLIFINTKLINNKYLTF